MMDDLGAGRARRLFVVMVALAVGFWYSHRLHFVFQGQLAPSFLSSFAAWIVSAYARCGAMRLELSTMTHRNACITAFVVMTRTSKT
jgi:uncharacterized membrane protein YfhO